MLARFINILLHKLSLNAFISASRCACTGCYNYALLDSIIPSRRKFIAVCVASTHKPTWVFVPSSDDYRVDNCKSDGLSSESNRALHLHITRGPTLYLKIYSSRLLTPASYCEEEYKKEPKIQTRTCVVAF